jgi:aminopeptidase N
MLFSLALGTSLLLDPDVRPPHQFDLLNVKYDIALDFKSESVSGYVENKLVTTEDDANLAFDKGPMQIKSVAVKGARNFVVKVTDTNVFVNLPGSKTGLPVTVTITYLAAPEAGVYFVNAKRAYPGTTDVAYSQGEMEDNRYWLPTYDYPDDKATAEGTIRVPKGMSVLSNGTLVSKADKGKQTIWTWKMDKAMSTYLISFVAGNYSAVYDGEFKEKPVQIWTPKGLEDWGRAAFQGTDSQIAIYSKLTGTDYPWQKYAQSAVPEFIFGGMENASCTTQTINALFPPNSRSLQSGEGLSAHELAHQWFGDLVTAPNWSHIWINEGWATFMPHFITRQKHGEDEYQIQRWGTYEGARFSAYEHPMVRADYTVPMEMFDGNAYPGGATRMFMLMNYLGEAKFWECCKAYLAEYGHKNVTTEQFFASWEKTAKRQITQFRKPWFYTKGVPKIRVTKSKDGYVIENVNKDFDQPISIDVQYLSEDGVYLKDSVPLMPRGSAEVSSSILKTVIVDPGAWLLCDIEYPDYTDDQWMLAYKSAENAAQKMRLLDRISKNNDTLMAIWQWERSQPVRNQLIPRLNDRAILKELLANKDEAVQLLALNRLNELNDPMVVQEANRIFTTTKNESMMNSAYSILLALKNDQATAELGWTTKTYNLATQTAALNWYATNRPATARKMAMDAVVNYAPGPVRQAAIGVLGKVKDEADKRDVFNLLVSIAKGRPYTPMVSAINALVEYGDKAAIPVIESRKNHSLHFGRGVVASALARLRP